MVFGSGDVELQISKKTGQMVSLKVKKKEYLKTPLQMNFWRPPVDNDRGHWREEDKARFYPWREAAANVEMVNMTEERGSDAYKVTFEYKVPLGETKAFVTYSFYGDGALGVNMKLDVKNSGTMFIPRIGFLCGLTPALKEWQWYGRGPEENYCDRNTGTFVGVWKENVREAWYPYTEPQETANRTDVHRAAFTAGQHGVMILADGGQLLEVGAYPFLQSDLEGPKHPTDIPLRGEITVNIAHRQTGVGGEDSWGAWPLEQYRISAEDGTYEYSFILRAF